MFSTEFFCHLPSGEGVPANQFLRETLNCWSWSWQANYSRFTPQDRPGTNMLFRHRYDTEMRTITQKLPRGTLPEIADMIECVLLANLYLDTHPHTGFLIIIK